jgi:tellurite methyltransferase
MSVGFFARQFERQIAAADYALNPFETCTLPHLRGRVLDLGCGLGNLSLAAARAGRRWDSVVAIGLLMFFDRADARRLLRQIRRAVAPGGIAAVNVLVTGTTYEQMFDPQRHCLFRPEELREAFDDWTVLLDRTDEFPGPERSVKRFATIIASRPAC